MRHRHNIYENLIINGGKTVMWAVTTPQLLATSTKHLMWNLGTLHRQTVWHFYSHRKYSAMENT